jgi:glyoxylase-like metal-dependent hydrolase (beta-lactamase superfamily II)
VHDRHSARADASPTQNRRDLALGPDSARCFATSTVLHALVIGPDPLFDMDNMIDAFLDLDERLGERFGCERVIHRADVHGATRDCERIIDGDTDLADDLRLIHVPGHTRGSIALLHGDVLFTGDHLWATDDQTGLEAGRDVCWYSWSEQVASIVKLAGVRFTHVLPGHGRRVHRGRCRCDACRDLRCRGDLTAE